MYSRLRVRKSKQKQAAPPVELLEKSNARLNWRQRFSVGNPTGGPYRACANRRFMIAFAFLPRVRAFRCGTFGCLQPQFILFALLSCSDCRWNSPAAKSSGSCAAKSKQPPKRVFLFFLFRFACVGFLWLFLN